MNNNACVCGHVDSSHLVVRGICRYCDCQRFLNDEHVKFLAEAAAADVRAAVEAAEELSRRRARGR